MKKFSIKFDSEIEEVDFSNAISIDELGELLKSIYSLLSAKKNDKVILSNIVDNCYQLDISTINPILENRFINAGKNVLEKSDIELNNKELRFKKSIASSLKVGWYMDILNAEGVKVITVPYGFNEKLIDTYYTIKNIEGYITEIGDKDINAKGLHIYLSDHTDFKIFITVEQHDELMSFYRKVKIRAKVQIKKSLSSDKILSAKLITFKSKSHSNFPLNLDDIDLSELNFIHE